MNIARLQTAGGCVLAVVLGAAAAAWKSQDLPLPTGEAQANAVSHTLEELTAGARPIDAQLAANLKEEKGAKRWLLLLAAAETASAKEMPGLIRAAGNDSAVARMLGARWAELDPMHMFRSLHAEYLQPDGTPGALPDRYGLMDTLFEHWAKSDPATLLKSLTDVPNFSGRDNLRVTAVNQLMKGDVETGLRALGDWGIRHYLPNMNKVKEWAAKDPKRAAEVILSSTSDMVSEEALRSVGKAWAQSNPMEAFQFASTLSPKAREKLSDSVMRDWADRDLKSAVAFATEQTDPAQRAAMGKALMETWGKSDPEAALAWGQEHLIGSAQIAAIGGLVKHAAETNLERAAELVSSLEAGPAQRDASASLFETWFKKGKEQRNAAFEWLASMPDKEAQSSALERVRWDWMWREPAEVREFITGPFGKLASESMIRQVAGNQAARNPEEALKWVEKLSAGQQEGARSAVLSSWLSVRPEGAAEYARKLPSGRERTQAIQTVSQTLVFQSTQQAAKWYRSLPEADQKSAREIFEGTGLTPMQRAELEKAMKSGE